jgi:sulfide dehydrogenase cytochrome subunit
MRKLGLRSLLMTLSLVVAAGPGLAQDAAPSGAQLANGCTACHGVEGRSISAIPGLAGRPGDELVELLKAYRAQQRPATIMNRIARGYTDDEIAALAAYFSSVSAK